MIPPLQALRDIHSHGVLHGDICAENIIVDSDGKVGVDGVDSDGMVGVDGVDSDGKVWMKLLKSEI